MGSGVGVAVGVGVLGGVAVGVGTGVGVDGGVGSAVGVGVLGADVGDGALVVSVTAVGVAAGAEAGSPQARPTVMTRARIPTAAVRLSVVPEILKARPSVPPDTEVLLTVLLRQAAWSDLVVRDAIRDITASTAPATLNHGSRA